MNFVYNNKENTGGGATPLSVVVTHRSRLLECLQLLDGENISFLQGFILPSSPQ